MIFMCINLSNNLEITLSDAGQPVMDAGFVGWENGHVRIFKNLIMGDNTDGPARKTPGGSAGIVYPMGNELCLAAENPISSVTVHDSESLVEPSLAREDLNKLFQNIHLFLICWNAKRPVFLFHVAPHIQRFTKKIPRVTISRTDAQAIFLTFKVKYLFLGQRQHIIFSTGPKSGKVSFCW